MVFSSTIFLFAFLPFFLAVYFALPWRSVKNVVLLAFSLVFYAWGEPVYVWLMIGSICANWVFALLIDRSGGGYFTEAASGSSACGQPCCAGVLQVPGVPRL